MRYRFFLYAGLRKREVLRLEFGHVNLTTKKILIEDGKGETDRVLDMAPELRTILGRFVAHGCALPLKAPARSRTER